MSSRIRNSWSRGLRSKRREACSMVARSQLGCSESHRTARRSSSPFGRIIVSSLPRLRSTLAGPSRRCRDDRRLRCPLAPESNYRPRCHSDQLATSPVEIWRSISSPTPSKHLRGTEWRVANSSQGSPENLPRPLHLACKTIPVSAPAHQRLSAARPRQLSASFAVTAAGALLYFLGLLCSVARAARCLVGTAYCANSNMA